MTSNINVFQIYTINDTDFLNATDVSNNLNNLSKLLDENIKELDDVLIETLDIDKMDVDEETSNIDKMDVVEEVSNSYEETIKNIFNFNVVDLLPAGTFRYVDRILDASKNGITMPKITDVRPISQLIDNMALDTGTSYLSLRLKTQMKPLENVEKTDIHVSSYNLGNLPYIINDIITRITNKDSEPKLFHDLFVFITMYLSDIKVSDIKVSDIKVSDIKVSVIDATLYEKCLNYFTTYTLLLYLFPAFVTFVGSTFITKNLYIDIFQKIHNVLTAAINNESTSAQIEELWNINSGSVPMEEEDKMILTTLNPMGKGVESVPMEVVSLGSSNKRKNDEPSIDPSKKQKNVQNIDFTRLFNKYPQVTQYVPPTPVQVTGQKRSREQLYREQPLKQLYRESNMPVPAGGFKGGSCERINLRNQLLYVKFLFEWSHDFGPTTVRAPKSISGEYGYNDFYSVTGIFSQIKEGWNDIIAKSKIDINATSNIDSTEDEIDKQIFNKLTSQDTKHDEPTYISTIVAAIISLCKQMKEDFLYIPVIEYTFTPEQNERSQEDEMNTFFEKVFKYFSNQRMFIKPDDTIKKIHLFITSDNTPTTETLEDKPLGFYMPDMNIEDIAVSLITDRKLLYTLWDTKIKSTNENNEQNIVTKIFGEFQKKTGEIINKAKLPEYEIKTPARLIDPITTSGVPATTGTKDNNKIISQKGSTLDKNEVFQETIRLATIYGINQLLHVWIDDPKVVNKYVLVGPPDTVDTIKFLLNNSTEFDWSVGDTTVNVICGALINVAKNMENMGSEVVFDNINEEMFNTLTNTDNDFSKSNLIERKNRWDRIYNITKQIFFHDNFRTDIPKTVRTVLMIISYLKSCGDEYQRLTCEFVNDAMNNINQDYGSIYLPPNNNLISPEDREALNKDLNGIVYLFTKDRILIGESIEKNTPVYTLIQSPHEAFYDNVDLVKEFYDISLNIVGRKNIGILTNRRKELSSPVERDLDKEIKDNSSKITNLLNEIFLTVGTLVDKNKQKQIIDDYVKTEITEEEQEKQNIIIEQKTKIDKLIVIALSMSYYTPGNDAITKTKYNSLIDTEISQAVSLTINSNLLDDIKLKNSCRVPKTVIALNSLIENMHDEPHIVDKLISSYEIANNLCKQKIETYKTNIEFYKTDIAGIGITTDNIITQYNTYIKYIDENKSNFLKTILKIVKDNLDAELRKSQTSRGSTKSHADTEEDKDKLANLLIKISNETLTIKEARDSLDAEQTNIQTNKPKTYISKFLSSANKRMKDITNTIKNTGQYLADLTKEKEKIEVRLLAKTKRYCLTTYTTLMDVLRTRQPQQGGKKQKTRKHKRNKHVTRKRMNNKKSIRKNRKHRITTKYKQTK
jgi:hypothetical protein